MSCCQNSQISFPLCIYNGIPNVPLYVSESEDLLIMHPKLLLFSKSTTLPIRGGHSMTMWVSINSALALVFETRLKLGNLQWKSNFNRNEALLLMIESIKTNQIGKILPGGYNMHLELPELSFCTLSPPVCHVFAKAIKIYYLLSIMIPPTFQPFQNRKS